MFEIVLFRVIMVNGLRQRHYVNEMTSKESWKFAKRPNENFWYGAEKNVLSHLNAMEILMLKIIER